MESLGERLKQERERKGITLEDVGVSTKISTRMLQALEAERYDQLPGGIFNKGFVRAYARHLGLDEEQAVADYVATTRPQPVGVQPVAVMEALAAHAVETRGERLSAIDRIPWGKMSILLLVVAIVLTIWGPRSPKRKPESAPQSSQPAHIPAPGTFLVRIQANEDSWLSVIADGRQIVQGVLPARSQESIEAKTGIVVKAGNIGALDFWFNGGKLAAQGALDEVKTLTFVPAGLQSAGARVPLPVNRAAP